MVVSYKQSSLKLIEHLNTKMDENGYPDEPSWGYAFSLLAALELEHEQFAAKSLALFNRQNKSSANYSWEFVIYALQRAKKLIQNTNATSYVYAEKGTRMVNWTLLRQLNRVNEGRDSLKVKMILWGIKKVFTHESGQILDELKTRSLQYHAFCLFVLAELDQTKYHPLAKSWLIKGCQHAIKMMRADGCALYIGRGQEQIFGYGSLVFALEYTNTKYQLNLNASIEKLWSYVQSFQRENGSYPLVLNREQPEKENVTFNLDKPHGWYGYNTLYDYQPFLAYCLGRADKFKRGDYE
ncbi:hypothetical protein C2869_10080 [Saccharobesus litoralis]|uniref:Uncharacterized protein n=1 Tax=Saccharobesus litoralis TaxID=2172099 RepID=A0A2S0VRM3_9ALTE|nr:hypothetical protein [Saccharobesus litoralis]AWB66750.1 hypothetical protein C2869_10080 [Saccharobesus litoralis]